MRLNRLELEIAQAKAGMSQTEIVRKAMVSRPTVNGIFNGRSCRPETGQKIADALGVKLEKLIEKP